MTRTAPRWAAPLAFAAAALAAAGAAKAVRGEDQDPRPAVRWQAGADAPTGELGRRTGAAPG